MLGQNLPSSTHDHIITVSTPPRNPSAIYNFVVSGTQFTLNAEQHNHFVPFFQSELRAGRHYGPILIEINKCDKLFDTILILLDDDSAKLPDKDTDLFQLLAEVKGYRLNQLATRIEMEIEKKKIHRKQYTEMASIIFNIGVPKFETWTFPPQWIFSCSNIFQEILDMEKPPRDSSGTLCILHNPRHVNVFSNFMAGLGLSLPESPKLLNEIKEDAKRFHFDEIVQLCDTKLSSIQRTLAGDMFTVRTTDGHVEHINIDILDGFPETRRFLEELQNSVEAGTIPVMNCTKSQLEKAIEFMRIGTMGDGWNREILESTEKVARLMRLHNLADRCAQKLAGLEASGPQFEQLEEGEVVDQEEEEAEEAAEEGVVVGGTMNTTNGERAGTGAGLNGTQTVEAINNDLEEGELQSDDDEENVTPINVSLRNGAQRVIRSDLLLRNMDTRKKLLQQPREANGDISLNCTPMQFDKFIAYMEDRIISIPQSEKAAEDFIKEARFWKLFALVEAAKAKFPRIAENSPIDNSGRMGVVRRQSVTQDANELGDLSVHDLNTSSIHCPHNATRVHFAAGTTSGSPQPATSADNRRQTNIMPAVVGPTQKRTRAPSARDNGSGSSKRGRGNHS